MDLDLAQRGMSSPRGDGVCSSCWEPGVATPSSKAVPDASPIPASAEVPISLPQPMISLRPGSPLPRQCTTAEFDSSRHRGAPTLVQQGGIIGCKRPLERTSRQGVASQNSHTNYGEHGPTSASPVQSGLSL